jgi:hypothetical protein
MSAKIRVLLFGCGVMGQKIAAALLRKKSFEIVGAIDIQPALAGKDLGDLLTPPRATGIKIETDPGAFLARVKPDAAIVATSSSLALLAEQIRPLVRAGVHVVSTCEELANPWLRQAELARSLDELAKKHSVTIVGTGINPGYLMDSLPLMLTAACERVKAVKVTRVLDSAKRRIPFQQKVGTNMTVAEFKEKIASGKITGHVGLRESAGLIAAGLGWTLDDVQESFPEPVIAKAPTPTALGTVEPGRVIGLRSQCTGKAGGETVVTLDFLAHAGVPEEYDEVRIEGEPNLHQKILGGVNGDIGTVAVTVNTVPGALVARPGVRTMRELSIPSCVP